MKQGALPAALIDTEDMKFHASDTRVRGVGWRGGRGVPPLAILVAALVLITSVGHLVAPVARAADAQKRVQELIVRYEIGAPPACTNGQPWGAQCVQGDMRELLKRGRWIGAGMRVIRLAEPVPVRRANVIAQQLAHCPYIAWVEPNAVRFDLPLVAAGGRRSVGA
jgi:hypothetical protein